MSETRHRDNRSSWVGPLAYDVGTLLPAAPGSAVATVEEVATEQEEVGQEGEIWNLGAQMNGRRYPTTLSAHNKSCRGKKDFRITVEGEAAEFLEITGPSVLEKIKRGETKTTDAVLDLVGVAPGVYNEGTVAVRCVNCSGPCGQDYTTLQVHLTVVGPEDEPDPGTEVAVADEGSGDEALAAGESESEGVTGEGESASGERFAAGATFSDSNGTGWNYCSGRCTKVVEKIKRADGTTSNVVRVKRGTCDSDCSCVLFKDSGGKLDKKLEVDGDKGYVDIGQDTGKNYTLRCCEED